MGLLEWAGTIAIVWFLLPWGLNISKSINPEKYSKDPGYSKRQFEFNRIGVALEKLHDLRDMEHYPHNEVISNVQSAIEDIVQSTAPQPKDAYASDYQSKYVDYTVIHYLANSIINSDLCNVQPAKDDTTHLHPYSSIRPVNSRLHRQNCTLRKLRFEINWRVTHWFYWCWSRTW